MFLAKGYLERKTRADKERELKNRVAHISRTADFDRILRLHKEEDFLRIGARDLGGLADTPEVMVKLSDLAAACLRQPLIFIGRGL